MNIIKATRLFERWLGTQTRLVHRELTRKHEVMTATPFHFLRATFYRWAQIWPEVCRDVADAPRVLAVGDLHVASFGTWRDVFGRLVWGIDDFDEAWPLPYTNDLVRLAVGAGLAADAEQLNLSLEDACDIVLDGYREQLHEGGRPFVLEEDHAHLRAIALSDLRAPQPFWDGLATCRRVRSGVPAPVTRAFRERLPGREAYRVVRRTAGIGGLGQQRFVALADWRGGHLAYEAKAMRPSAVTWAHPGHGRVSVRALDIMRQAVRAPDPFVVLNGGWLLHRLAPDIAPVDIEHLPKKRDDEALLQSMARETANVHGGRAGRRAAVLRDLRRRRGRWLRDAARIAMRAVHRDWKEWRKSRT